MARSFKRSLGSLTYADGATVRLDLPRNHVFKSLLLKLAGNVTITGGASSSNVHDENPMSLLRAVRVIRNGSEVLWSLDGGTLYHVAQFTHGVAPAINALANGDAQDTDFYVDIPIDFAALGMDGESLTLLRAVGTSSLVLEVTFGDISSISDESGDRTETLSGVTLDVYGFEIMDISGRYADKVMTAITREVTAGQSDFKFDLQVGPMYRRCWIKTTDTDDFVLDNAIVTDVKLVIDGSLYLIDKWNFLSFRSHNKIVDGIESMPDGYCMIDFAEDGAMQGLLASAGASEVEVLLTVATGTGTTRARVITEAYHAAKVPPGQE